MDRYVLTDAQWAKMEPHYLGKRSDPGRSGRDNRRFVEAVLWIARTGSPWRDLPAHFDNWSTTFHRFRDWHEADVFVRLFEACSDEPAMEYAMVTENAFCRLKDFRRVATRYDKLAANFLSGVALATAIAFWL